MNSEFGLIISDRSLVNEDSVISFIKHLIENDTITGEGDVKISNKRYDPSQNGWVGEEFEPADKSEIIEIIKNIGTKHIEIEFPFKNCYGSGEETKISSFIKELNELSSEVSNKIGSYYSPDFYIKVGFKNGTFYDEGGSYELCAFYVCGDGYPDDETKFTTEFDILADERSKKYKLLKSAIENSFQQKPRLYIELKEG